MRTVTQSISRDWGTLVGNPIWSPCLSKVRWVTSMRTRDYPILPDALYALWINDTLSPHTPSQIKANKESDWGLMALFLTRNKAVSLPSFLVTVLLLLSGFKSSYCPKDTCRASSPCLLGLPLSLLRWVPQNQHHWTLHAEKEVVWVSFTCAFLMETCITL